MLILSFDSHRSGFRLILAAFAELLKYFMERTGCRRRVWEVLAPARKATIDY